ncbi:hypothetical protein IJZ97_01250 [bacterium]|nr:hypothetical protein [bacterium]
MEIKNCQNSSTFQSRIVVLSPERFNKTVNRMRDGLRNFDCIYEYDLDIKEGSKAYRTNVDNIVTEGVRSCTAVVKANKGSKAPLVAHIRNSEENLKRLYLLDTPNECTNAILIGSKRFYKKSSEVFDAIMRKAKNVPTTIMKGLKLRWEAQIAFNSKKDTLYLCVNEINNKRPKYAKNMKDLKSCFDKFVISSEDKIEFLTK